MSNGHLKGQDIERDGLQPTLNQTQPPATKYVQTNGYASETYKTAPTSSLTGGESGQGLTGSVSPAPPPPVYTGPWQYPQIDHTSSEAGYQTTSNHHGPVYGGSAVDYHEDASQLPHMSPSILGPRNYHGYQPHLSEQYFLQWDESNAAALWPNTIMVMPHPPHQQHQQQPQQQQQQQQ